MFKEIDAIIFDWDNTLFDFKGYWEKAHKQLFFQYKYDSFGINFEKFMDVYRAKDNELWSQVLHKEMTIDELRIKRLILSLKHFNVTIEEEEAQKFFSCFFELLLESIEPDYILINNIKKISKKYDISILTNGKVREQKEKISRSNFNQIIPYYISESIGYEKPDRRAFEYIISERKLNIKTTLMVGDSYSNDIIPAQNLGIKTAYIGVDNIKSDYSFKTISEFMDEVMKNI
jgi:putative hydrolase of the HAD superfamily